MAEVPTEELEVMKSGFHVSWKKAWDIFQMAPVLIPLTIIPLVWFADHVFATDAELNKAKEELSEQISETETNIICGGIELQIIQLKAERKALLRMELDLGAVDKHVLSDLNDQWDKRCDGGPHR